MFYNQIVSTHIYLELQTTSFLWLFQLNDSKSLHKKWLFRVPGTIHPKSRYDSVRLTLDKVHVKNVDVIYERALTTSNIEERVNPLQPGFNSFG